MQRVPLQKGPTFSDFSVDFIVALLCSQGHSVILTIVDLLTKMVHFILWLTVPSACETTHAFLEH